MLTDSSQEPISLLSSNTITLSTLNPRVNLSSTETPDWHALSGEVVLDQLATSLSGLQPDQFRERFARYGANQIVKKQTDNVLRLLWRQINSPLIWVLIGSGSLAIGLGKLTDGLVVLAVVVINALIGFLQEYKASRAIEALTGMVPQNATVIREGKSRYVSAAELVPGDIVQLTAGDLVPADMRLLITKNLQADEASLTGESLPVEKAVSAVAGDAVLGDRASMVYSGTLITAGIATAVVTSTGMATELGRISTLLESAVDLETPLTKRLREMSKVITLGIILVTLVILGLGLSRALSQGIALPLAARETLVFAIALAVGAIPEGLPAVVTIALAIGVQRMANRNAIIRKLPAVETLGSTTVICSDKTGTLTCNEMTVTAMWTPEGACQISGSGYDPEGDLYIEGHKISHLPSSMLTLLTSAALCNDAELHRHHGAWAITGDPTEAALVVAAAKAGLVADEIRSQHPRLDTLPFASEQQYMATLHGGAEPRVILKGAPESILSRCRLHGHASHESIGLAMARMGGDGMRVLAVAAKPVEPDTGTLDTSILADGFTFLGLLGMIDPLRPEAIDAVQACHRAGIIVKMITGDHRATALAIGTSLNLAHSGQAITGAELALADDQRVKDLAVAHNIFARVAPEHKLRLVKALQHHHQVVAMTGDGVNDAPSLKQANIGVAMGITGTAVSRESADIVLADDNFASISAAVEEGRRVYDNLLKSLAFLLPTNLGLALILVYGILFFPFDPIDKALLLPMLPAQLLWINLVAAVTLALPLAFEAKEPDIMQRPPRNPEAPLFNAFVMSRVVLVSLLMTAGAIVLFHREYSQELLAGTAAATALAKAQTLAVSFVVLFQIFYMIHCRSLKDNLLKIGLFSNPAVFLGIAGILLLQVGLIYLPFMQAVFGTVPLGWPELALGTVAGFVIVPVITIEKWLRLHCGRSPASTGANHQKR